MEITYLFISIVIALLYIIIKYKRRRKSDFILPSTIFMLMWAAAMVASVITQTNNLDPFGFDYEVTTQYIFKFIVVSLLAFLISGEVVPNRTKYLKFEIGYIEHLLNKFRIFIYLSFILGLVRIFLIISLFGWNSLYDYRQSAFLIFKLESAKSYAIISQVSSYVYILATFFIVLLSIKHALTRINTREMIVYFLLFSAQAMSIGGRMFVIDFISCYFFIFILIRTQNKNLFEKKEILPFITSLAILISIVMVVGVIRNDNDKSSKEITNDTYYTKLLYLQDGIAYTTILFNKIPEQTRNLDLGKNITSIDRENTSLNEFRNRTDMIKYLPLVTGIIPYIYFDFGYWGSLIMWFLICLLVESISKRMLNKGTVFGILLVFVFIRFFYDTPLMVSSGRGFFRYLIVLLIVYSLSDKYFMSYRTWKQRFSPKKGQINKLPLKKNSIETNFSS